MRPEFIAVVVFTGLLLAAAWLTRGGKEPRQIPFRARDWVLISAFENTTGDRTFDGMLDYALERDLSESRYVNVVPKLRIADILSLMKKPADVRVDAGLGREICIRDGGIRALVAGRISKSGKRYVLDISLVDPQTSATVAACADEGTDRERVLDSLSRCASEIRTSLGEAPAQIRQDARKLASVTTPSLRALELYSTAQSAAGKGKYDVAEQLLKEAIAADRQFASAYISLALNIHDQWDMTRPKEDWLRPAQKAFELSETVTDRERYFIRGSYYQLTGDLNKARLAYEDLLALYPDDYAAVDNLYYVYWLLGQTQNAADMTARRADLKPSGFFENYWAARILIESGRDSEAEKYRLRAEKLLPEFPPEILRQHTDWVPRLHMLPAYSAWLRGDSEQALRTLSEVGRSAGQNEATIAEIANLYMLMGRLRDAEAWSLRLTDRNRRQTNLEMIAFERGDGKTLSRYIPEQNQAADFLALIVAGTPELPPHVQSRVVSEIQHRMKAANDSYSELVRGLIALAQNQRQDGIARLRRGLKGSAEILGVTLMARILLARALEDGDPGAAAEVLEPSIGTMRHCVLGVGLQPVHDETGRPLLHYGTGNLWLRTQVELAHIYIRMGRIDEARRLKDELGKLLACADGDYVPLRELKAIEKING